MQVPEAAGYLLLLACLLTVPAPPPPLQAHIELNAIDLAWGEC